MAKRHAVLVGLLAAAGYARLLRERVLTWGATEAEAGARLPGDELLEDADGVATRAITIDAPASAVWPWVAQMGPSPRGGAYTYNWVESLLGLNMHSVDRVLPEFQEPQEGEVLGYGKNRMRFERVEPNGAQDAARDQAARRAARGAECLAGRRAVLGLRTLVPTTFRSTCR